MMYTCSKKYILIIDNSYCKHRINKNNNSYNSYNSYNNNNNNFC